MRRSAILLVFLCLILSGSECQSTDVENREVDRTHIEPLDEGRIWASSPWPHEINDENVDSLGLIQIEPGHNVTILHNLGRAPVEIHAYVGFGAKDSMVMPSSGNAAEIREVTETLFTIRNGSGGSFFYRFVLR